MSDPESRPRSKKGLFSLIGAALIAVLMFVPLWKCPPCQGTGKAGLFATDCTVCKTKGRVAAIPTLFEIFWGSFKLRSPIH